MNISACLIYLGYKPNEDFVLYDESDGKGPYIKEWLSPDPKPTKAELQEVEQLAIDKEEKDMLNWQIEAELNSINLSDIIVELMDALEQKSILALAELSPSSQERLLKVKDMKNKLKDNQSNNI